MSASAPCLRIDVHTHILPKEDWPFPGRPGYLSIEHTPCCAGSKCSANMMRSDGTLFRRVDESLWDLDTRAAEADTRSVGVHVLSTVPVMFNYDKPAEEALEYSKFLNDHMAACVAKNPRRFVGLGTVPMQAPELAIQEMKRCVQELGLAGVEIGTHVGDLTLAAPQLDSFFKTAEEIGAAIFVHPWDMMGSNLMKDYFLPWLVGMPAETSLAICSMMFSGLFERYPRLRVCFAHGGGSFPGTLARVQHGFDVRPDLCAKDCKRSPVEQCGSFWTDSLVHDPHALRDIVRIFGEDKVCLGTDYPFPLGEYTAESRGKDYAAGALIDSMEWAPGQKEKLLGSNACAWLNRDIVDFWK